MEKYEVNLRLRFSGNLITFDRPPKALEGPRIPLAFEKTLVGNPLEIRALTSNYTRYLMDVRR